MSIRTRYCDDALCCIDIRPSGAQIHDSYHSETYDVGAARVIVFGLPLWLDVKPPRVILQVIVNVSRELVNIIRWRL